MNARQYHALTLRETDVDGTIHRLCGSENVYVSCLKAFLSDQTMGELNDAIGRQEWDEAFTAAHSLKGVAGNMGFIPLMHSTARLIVLIRSGRTSEIDESIAQVNSSYRDIIDGINQFIAFSGEKM